MGLRSTKLFVLVAIGASVVVGGLSLASSVAGKQSRRPRADVLAAAASVSAAVRYCGSALGEEKVILQAGTSCATARHVSSAASCTPGGDACKSGGFGCVDDRLGQYMTELVCESRRALVVVQTP